MCYVAANRAGVTYCGILPDRSDAWKIWDYAAATLVATEAGAVMSGTDGKEFRIDGDSMVCAANATVMKQVLGILRS